MKNVLLISQDYPPQGYTSSRRSGGMAKYLSDYGWQPIVVCQKWTPANCWYDPTIVTNIPKSVLVYEVEVAPTRQWSCNYANNLVRRVLFPHLFTKEFVEHAKAVLCQVFRNHTIDAIWATAPMACNHALADWTAKRWNRPWVADFRDVLQFKGSLRGRVVRPIRIFHERRILGTASVLTTVTEGFAAAMQKRHERSVEVIPNGFDGEFLAVGEPIQLSNFDIVYTGGINLGNPDFRKLVDAIAALVCSGEINQYDISLNFYGAGNERALERMFRGHPFGKLVRNHGRLAREKIFERQQTAAVLLQATYPGTGTLSSKIYEYLMAQRPILAVPNDHGEIAGLLKKTNAGVCCTSVDEISFQLGRWYREWKKTGTIQCHSNQTAIMQYTRREQAKQLADVLNRIVL